MVTTTQTAHRVVVGVDGSACSVAALHWAAHYAEMTEGYVEALTTWEWPVTYGAAMVVPTGYDPDVDARKVLETALEPVRDAHPGVVFKPVVVQSHPAPALVEASQGADLVVVGSRGHREFAGMLLGSVSQHCVTNAHCPVVVVREQV